MELKDILEALLFTAQKPLTAAELRDVLKNTAENSEDPAAGAFKKTPLENIEAALEQLRREHDDARRSYRLACVAGAWQFVSQPQFACWLQTLLGQKTRPPRLSQPALETLAIVAYRQPTTRAEIEQVRGVAVDGVMQTLLERGLVEQTGRAEVVGRPALYGTTPAFLEYFGLRSLDDLPAADELRRIPVQKPEALLTVEPGLATAPATQMTLEQVGVPPGTEAAATATTEAAPAASAEAAPAPVAEAAPAEAAPVAEPAPAVAEAPAEPAPAPEAPAEPAPEPAPRKRRKGQPKTEAPAASEAAPAPEPPPAPAEEAGQSGGETPA